MDAPACVILSLAARLVSARCIRAKTEAKKTPLGEWGIRVIVVVANSVSVAAYGPWWIIVVVLTNFIIVVVVVFSCSYFIRLTSGFDYLVRCRSGPASQKPFCAQQYISKSCANFVLA
jgi:hypothetical protein